MASQTAELQGAAAVLTDVDPAMPGAAAWRGTFDEGGGMPSGVNHRHHHVEADGRLGGRRYQYRRKARDAVASRSKATPDSRRRVGACNMLQCSLYRR